METKATNQDQNSERDVEKSKERIETAEGYKIHCDPTKRHDFVYLYDCKMGNPNGDPDTDGAPRVDLETMRGIVTGVAMKRRSRNYVSIASEQEPDEKRRDRLGIFFANKGVLNETIREARQEAGFAVGKAVERDIRDENVAGELEGLEDAGVLPTGFSMPGNGKLAYTGELTPPELKAALNEIVSDAGISKKARSTLEGMARDAGKPEKSREATTATGGVLRNRHWDVRMFGAVMTTGVNGGQAQGPLQIVDATTVHQVSMMDMTITRSSVTREEEREEKQSTMGRRSVIRYGLFRAHGFFTPHFASDTGADARDLELFWDSLEMMWDLDRSASRGEMGHQSPLAIFTHDNPLGGAPAHKLFGRIKVKQKDSVEIPQSFDDFDVEVDNDGLPKGVTLTII